MKRAYWTESVEADSQSKVKNILISNFPNSLWNF